ncbi:MAG: hypothetical protein Sv326_1161 [Candidatus Fermentimicrarchaeum limneticum]|uniref:Uncharacterized protein n=1 Tax=Fermentimicrarchaeum limneticum TaxID=2795018 RepID=A0A7D6BM17_FERL1|nr:MAG: hypothetical protein Sv326_1161 [Candidatus Fermentimicrarchaeum limneticum]
MVGRVPNGEARRKLESGGLMPATLFFIRYRFHLTDFLKFSK